MDKRDGELACCPCCGGEAEIDQDEFGVLVRCTDCGLNTGGEFARRLTGGENEHVERWNKRQPKVYLVTDGEYSDYWVVGVYSSEAKAMRARELYYAHNGIDDRTLDEMPGAPPGQVGFGVTIQKNGHVVRADRLNGDRVEDKWTTEKMEDAVCFSMWAIDEQHAIKIANERRVQLIESGLWTTNFDVWVSQREKQ